MVGRIASIINPEHIKIHGEKAGFFGFYESIDDKEVAQALLGKVSRELADEGLSIVRGPMNFSTNEECGFLAEGFDCPSMLMTPYTPPYYLDLMSACGMEKSKDLIAFIYSVKKELPEKVGRVAALAERKGIRARILDRRRFEAEMKAFQKVYNSAWKDNWGFLPLTDDELAFSAAMLKPLVVPDLISIAEKDGEPVGFLGMIPDYNLVLRQMGGRLTPLTLLKALIYRRRITDLRLLLLGIREDFRNRGVDALMFREAFKGVLRGNYKRVEFSWILEENIPTIRMVEMTGGTRYKTFRVFERKIT